MKFNINANQHFYLTHPNFQEIWKSQSLQIFTLKKKCHYFCTGVYQDSSPTTGPKRIFEQKCFIREIKDIDGDEVEILAMVQYKTDRWPLKNKAWPNMGSLEQCAGSDEVFRAIRKSKNNMDQIDKTNINDKSSSCVTIYFQLIASFFKDSHLCRIWDLSCKIILYH